MINGVYRHGKFYGSKVEKFCIGSAADEFDPNYFFDGDIDDVRIYNVALTEEQISGL